MSESMITIIDSDNYAAAGIETMFFPGGEPHVKAAAVTGDVLLYLKLRTWADVGFAALVIDALHRSLRVRLFRVFIPYFPGARQDKPSFGTAGTLDVMHALLLQHGPVYVLDPHSSVLGAYLRHGCWLMPADLPLQVKPDVVGIICPDEGAFARAFAFRAKFYPTSAIVLCHKNRNPDTGHLSGYRMDPLPAAGRYIIVDDICDGGGTFNLLAEAFKADALGAASRLELFVSHGIFSKGLEALDPAIEHITTTNSWCQLPPSDRLTVMPLNSLFPMITGEINA